VYDAVIFRLQPSHREHSALTTYCAIISRLPAALRVEYRVVEDYDPLAILLPLRDLEDSAFGLVLHTYVTSLSRHLPYRNRQSTLGKL
jgi:hypothetical protein